ncbi:hypothetical protein JVU11DRAFT_4878 [Chiua virens]|nr:hypothetical protein JVU11DRAFT_4878 [Chiua virens]
MPAESGRSVLLTSSIATCTTSSSLSQLCRHAHSTIADKDWLTQYSALVKHCGAVPECTNSSVMLLALPQEILLHILSFLDIPDLAALSHVSKALGLLTADPVLHRTRLREPRGYPSQTNYLRIGTSGRDARTPHGTETTYRRVSILPSCKCTEHHLPLPSYTHVSPQAAKQYESTLHLQQTHTKVVLSSYLRNRLSPPTALKSLHLSHVLPDIESSIISVSRTLLPVVHKLKWSIQKDNMSRIIRPHTSGAMNLSEPTHPFNGNFGAWVELKGTNIFGESERVRLALCPDVRKMIKFYEELG